MNLNWYKDYLKKKDILTSLPKYIVANEAIEQEGDLKPYYVVAIKGNRAFIVDSLKDIRIRDINEQEALKQFLLHYRKLQGYLNNGIPVKARLDEKMWQEELSNGKAEAARKARHDVALWKQEEKRKEIMKQLKKEREQNTWYNRESLQD